MDEKLFKFLKFLRLIEEVDKKDNKKIYLGEKSYSLECFNKTITVYCMNNEKSIRALFNLGKDYKITNNDFGINGKGNRSIILFKDLSELDRLKWIFRKSYAVVKDITSSLGILDSETEAYMFGYLVSNQIKDFIYIYNLLNGIKSCKKIIDNVGNEVDSVIYSGGVYKDESFQNTFRLGLSADGSVRWCKGVKKFIVLVPKSRNRRIKRDLEIWSHELYHLARNSYACLNDRFLSTEDLLERYMEISLPVLKYMIWTKVKKGVW